MRIEIKTTQPIKDPDVKALYLVNHALSKLTLKMQLATLQFFADKLGFEVKRKD